MNTTRRSLFAAALAFGARCFGKAAWPTGGYVANDQPAMLHGCCGTVTPEQLAYLESVVAPLVLPLSANGFAYRLTSDAREVAAVRVDVSNGGFANLVFVQSAIAQVKPVREKDGKVWRRSEVTGLIGYTAQGDIYWREGDGPWERV